MKLDCSFSALAGGEITGGDGFTYSLKGKEGPRMKVYQSSGRRLLEWVRRQEISILRLVVSAVGILCREFMSNRENDPRIEWVFSENVDMCL